MSLVSTVALLLILAVSGGLGSGNLTHISRCRCINKETRPILRYIKTLTVCPANSHCSEVEIIATLKKNGQRVCLDPEAKWVKRLIRSSKYSCDRTRMSLV